MVDIELLKGYLENLGQDTLQQMISLYVNQSEIYLQDISQALKNDDQKLWQEHCHKMKGAAGSAGLTSVHAKLVLMEKSTQAQAIKTVLLEELQQENNAAVAAFNEWLASQ